MSKVNVKKEDLRLQITSVKEEMQKVRKEAQAENVKAYELMCVYFVGEPWTEWDKVVQEMHGTDPWVAVNGTSHKGPHMKTWTSFLDCFELHKLTIFSCDTAELQRYLTQQGIKKPQCVPVCSFMV